MNPSNHRHSKTFLEPQEDDPGAYPIPFQVNNKGVEMGSRLDTIPVGIRFWAVNVKRAHARWHSDMVRANDRYEEWLATQPAAEYPLPFAEGKRISEIEESLRNWAINPARSSQPWYNYFVRANTRYQQSLIEMLQQLILPPGIIHNYEGVPIQDVPQDEIWWALRPSNGDKYWYQSLYDANSHYLDNLYGSRSPGSELIWFGKRYRGLRLDQVYERKSFMNWCYDPQRKEQGWLLRFKDLVHRLERWRAAHPERSGPRQRRAAAVILNPVGEAIGPWDDTAGSAGEDEGYERDDFVRSDNEEPEFDSDEEFSDEVADVHNDYPLDPDESMNSDLEATNPGGETRSRKRANVVRSDDEGLEKGNARVGKLGRRYRVPYENSEEE